MVLALAVVVYQPTPATIGFDPLPIYYLAKLDGHYYTDAGNCEMCRRGEPLDRIRR